jgi:hypothetical protein
MTQASQSKNNACRCLGRYSRRLTKYKYSILFTLIIFPASLFSQETGEDSVRSTWSFNASGYYYIIPGQENTLSLIAYANHKALHLEGRYNYEDEKTGSVFAGWRFQTGNKLVFGVTPMIGLVVGNTDGAAPAMELDASYKIFDFYSETEYVVDFSGKENNFLYTWGTVGVTPFRKFRTGISYQRTKLYQSNFDIQRGIFAEYQFWKLTTGVYFFDPFSSSQFLVTTLSFEF